MIEINIVIILWSKKLQPSKIFNKKSNQSNNNFQWEKKQKLSLFGLNWLNIIIKNDSSMFVHLIDFLSSLFLMIFNLLDLVVFEFFGKLSSFKLKAVIEINIVIILWSNKLQPSKIFNKKSNQSKNNIQWEKKQKFIWA